MPDSQPAPVDVVLVHSSDLHVDDDRIAHAHGGDGTLGLAAVLACARANNADIVLLVGDTFDNNRVPFSVVDRAGRLLADAGRQVVILQGNHDPALPDSVFGDGGLDCFCYIAAHAFGKELFRQADAQAGQRLLQVACVIFLFTLQRS